MGSVTVRQAAAGDADFAFRCERETMQAYAIATWGKWSAEDAQARCADNIQNGLTQLIELGGVPVGILRVDRNAAWIDLKQIFILPEYQRRGIGSDVIRRLIAEAHAKRVSVRLRVLRVNPAQGLYRRLGFSVVRSTAEHEYMEYAL